MKEYPIFFISLILLFIALGCKPKCYNTYNFEIPVKITSKNDTLTIGDTLIYQFEITELLKDTHSNEFYDTDKQIEFWLEKGLIGIKKLSDESLSFRDQINAEYAFTILNSNNKIITIQDGIFYSSLTKLDNNYKCNIRFIPKEVGIYNILTEFNNTSSHNSISKIDIKNDKCTEYLEGLYFSVNAKEDGTFDNNSEILLNNVSDSPLGHKEDEVSYTFVVK
ncbi:hypothetical protein [Putridiphycobacter roseus]|nr:hypothetical protein [Putridiphycobacter roseus]